MTFHICNNPPATLFLELPKDSESLTNCKIPLPQRALIHFVPHSELPYRFEERVVETTCESKILVGRSVVEYPSSYSLLNQNCSGSILIFIYVRIALSL